MEAQQTSVANSTANMVSLVGQSGSSADRLSGQQTEWTAQQTAQQAQQTEWIAQWTEWTAQQAQQTV